MSKTPKTLMGWATTGSVGKFKIERNRSRQARERAAVALKAMTDKEDAAITAAADADPDNLPADDLFRRRGRPPLDRPKEAIKLRIDPEVLDHFKASGPGWQTRMNDALRKAAGLE